MNRPGIELWSPVLLANTLRISPIEKKEVPSHFLFNVLFCAGSLLLTVTWSFRLTVKTGDNVT